jgi:protein gp37
MSKIEWTGETWNPLVGCTVHSSGCKGCYAMKDAYRLMHNPHPAIAAKFAGTAKMVNGHAVWTGRINFDEATLLKPLKRRGATTYFVNSMSDLFHQAVTDEQIDRIFAVMALCPQHTFQVLTKRADRMRAYLSDPAWPSRVSDIVNAWPEKEIGHGNEFSGDFALCFGSQLPNVWLGVSVEDQPAADERIPDLLATPAAVRFLSCEPLLGFIDLGAAWHGESALASECWGECNWCRNGASFPPLWNCQQGRQSGADADKMRSGVDWVICGGESGPRARPMEAEWARLLRDQCASAGVPFFFKQWGNYLPAGQVATQTGLWSPSGDNPPPLCTTKKNAGRQLDGVEHSGMPA